MVEYQLVYIFIFEAHSNEDDKTLLAQTWLVTVKLLPQQY